MRILPEYLKYRIKILLLFLTAYCISRAQRFRFFYDLPTEPVLYAFALSGTGAWGVRRFRFRTVCAPSPPPVESPFVRRCGHIGASAAAEFAGGGSLPHHIRDL